MRSDRPRRTSAEPPPSTSIAAIRTLGGVGAALAGGRLERRVQEVRLVGVGCDHGEAHLAERDPVQRVGRAEHAAERPGERLDGDGAGVVGHRAAGDRDRQRQRIGQREQAVEVLAEAALVAQAGERVGAGVADARGARPGCGARRRATASASSSGSNGLW